MKKEYNVGVHNEFEIVVRDAKTEKVKRQEKAYNIILNQFWNKYLQGYYCLNYIHFGSGTAIPVATDTLLTTFIASKASSSISQDLSTFYVDGIIKNKCSIRLQDTEYIGVSISEVGFGHSTTTDSLVTKSLIKDQNGNPLSITKGASEVIDIYATFYVKVPTSINGGKVYFDKGAVPTTGMLGFLCCYGYPGSGYDMYFPGYVPPKAFELTPDKYEQSGRSLSCDIPNKKFTITLPNIIASAGNIGGFETIRVAENMIVEVPCEGFAQPVITKEVIATGNGVTKDFKCAFGRILNNGTAKLYVNDVEVLATFDYEQPWADDDIHRWMPILSGDPRNYTAEMEMENPSKFGLETIYGSYFNLYASNDRTNWTLTASRSSTSGSTVTINSTYKDYRYWKIAPYGVTQGWNVTYIRSPECLANLVVHADSAPEVGATVALTYQPRCLAKDASHVINNMSIALTFNEYTPT